MRLFARVVMLLALVVFSACGTTDEPPALPDAPAKPLLEGMAESGELDSSVILIREKFEAMKETDPAKGDELLKDLEALEAARTPREVKKKAKALAEKL